MRGSGNGWLRPILLLGAMLASCQLVSQMASSLPSAVPGGTTTAQEPGPPGQVVVKVSSGVILLTPGAPLPTPAFAISEAPGTSFAESATPTSATSTPISGTALAKALPAGVPLYSGAVNFQSSAQTGSMSGVEYLSFEVNDPPDRVLAFYETQLAAAKWSAMNLGTPTPDASGKTSLAWTNAERLMISVSVQKGDDGLTQVMITWVHL